LDFKATFGLRPIRFEIIEGGYIGHFTSFNGNNVMQMSGEAICEISHSQQKQENQNDEETAQGKTPRLVGNDGRL
jgi:hypothetical protein